MLYERKLCVLLVTTKQSVYKNTGLPNSVTKICTMFFLSLTYGNFWEIFFKNRRLTVKLKWMFTIVSLPINDVFSGTVMLKIYGVL
jgi:hypothetical protein